MLTRAALLLAALGACAGGSGLDRGDDPVDDWPDDGVALLTDHTGSVTTTVDARGEIASRRSYHPYGAVRASTGAGDPYGYAGNERDSGSGLGHFDARPYRHGAAAFLSVDPLALDPQSRPDHAALHAYAYARGNPIALVDPDGRKPKDAEETQRRFENAVDAQITRARNLRDIYNDRDGMIGQITEYDGRAVGGYVFPWYKGLGSSRAKVPGYRLGYVNIRAPHGWKARPGLGVGCPNCTQKGSLALVIAVRPGFDVDDITDNADHYNRLSTKIDAPVYVVSNGDEVFRFHEGEMTQTHPRPDDGAGDTDERKRERDRDEDG